MAVVTLKKLPDQLSGGKSSSSLYMRKAAIMDDLEKIVNDGIENCELTNLALSRTYGKEMIEGVIRKWCSRKCAGSHVDHFRLSKAFSVIRSVNDDQYHYYIHFDRDLWQSLWNVTEKGRNDDDAGY